MVRARRRKVKMESRFLTKLVIEELSKEGSWEVEADLRYFSALLGKEIVVKAGIVTDLASVPRLPIIYSLWGNRAHREAVIHDMLYGTHLVKKSVADKIFLEAMLSNSADHPPKPWHIAYPMYLAVKFGGASSYKTGPKRFTMLNPFTMA